MYSLGIDFGTSGARAVVLSGDRTLPAKPIAQAACAYPGRNNRPLTSLWQEALWTLLGAIAPTTRQQIVRIAINGTSATMLLCDGQGAPLTDALMYNDAAARNALADVRAIAPNNSPTLSATSTLTKALWLRKTEALHHSKDVRIAHQADWLACRLHKQTPVSDYHNALKLGYDVEVLGYPDWLLASPIASWLPQVLEPGAPIAPISADVADQFSIPKICQICVGTTDSIAAFLASGASQVGEATTSLGSTLVLKLLSEKQVDDQTFGIYSHRLADLWLVGGASNTGGAVLQKYFSPAQLSELSEQIDLSEACELNYYPLLSPGERFPVNDPDYPPRLTPRPLRDVDFLYGMLDAIARIEAEGYRKLQSLGSPALRRVYTAGGGAKNAKWQLLRARHLGVQVRRAEHAEAAYGTAKLAMNGLDAYRASASHA